MSDQRSCDPSQHHGKGDQPSQEVRVVHRPQIPPPLRARHASLCGGAATGADGDRAEP
jgi:hypothetical protein